MEFKESGLNIEAKKSVNHKYEVDNISIEVKCKEFFPVNKEYDPSKAVIFLPGWSMGAGVDSERELNQSLANNSGEKTYSIVTRAESIIPDSLLKEAEAIRLFIKDNGLNEVTIAGHSEGGNKAVNLVSLLQYKNPDIKVKGLLLFNMVGLYEQDDKELAGSFIKDILVDTLPDNLKDQSKIRFKHGHVLTKTEKIKSSLDITKNTIGAGFDIMKGVSKEVSLSGFNYSKRLTSQIQEMASKNKRIETIKVPIILINGTKDPISSREKIASKSEEDINTENYLQSLNSDSSEIGLSIKIKIREKYLKENLFPQSPYVKMVFANDFGHHGLPLFRAESVAKVSLSLLKRYSRT